MSSTLLSVFNKNVYLGLRTLFAPKFIYPWSTCPPISLGFPCSPTKNSKIQSHEDILLKDYGETKNIPPPSDQSPRRLETLL